MTPLCGGAGLIKELSDAASRQWPRITFNIEFHRNGMLRDFVERDHSRILGVLEVGDHFSSFTL
jgi:hypothetical protein